MYKIKAKTIKENGGVKIETDIKDSDMFELLSCIMTSMNILGEEFDISDKEVLKLIKKLGKQK